jgi:hypothetical protein
MVNGFDGILVGETIDVHEWIYYFAFSSMELPLLSTSSNETFQSIRNRKEKLFVPEMNSFVEFLQI